MYADMQATQAAQAAGGAGAHDNVSGDSATGGKPADDNVVDAEVKEVKKG
jgi:molecular chaperone DnaK